MHCHGQSTIQPTASERPAAWVAVVPVKPLRAAKTRLRGAVPEAVHPDLVLAMARDTVAAALACRAVARVVVICDDPAVCAELTTLGALCLPDAPAAGLNAALAYGAQAAQRPLGPFHARATATDGEPGADGPGSALGAGGTAGADEADVNRTQRDQLTAPERADATGADAALMGAARTPAVHPGAGRADAARTDAARTDAARTETGRADAGRADAVSVVALTADLPAMRPEDLESALVAAARTGRRAFVPDLEGTGTVLLAAPAGQALTPHFGPGSAAAHLRSGAVRLDGAWPSLRRDVDTAADLDAAARLGLGTHTGQVICTVA
ncbi:hypothetical protein GCM10022255_026120 [Dactylosporangium darangshiense]|uniref:Phosphoenolpyruvate guanylyltransferase n=1 Tax=Dactylosporangium darangshiense TaxID=579108 RepID=A0ABP8D6D6_9ACTN